MRSTILMVALLRSLLIWQFFPIVISVEKAKDISEIDICNLKCGESKRKMCEEKKKPSCEPFQSFEISVDARHNHFLKVLVEGHNGLRSRVAERMNVSNMLELTWDEKLARMAENYVSSCDPSATDPCAHSEKLLDDEDNISEVFKENTQEPIISLNSYFESGQFYPYKFLERMLRNWYFEKESMKKPVQTRLGSGDYRGRLLGENNFTHFIFPWSHRFGCALAKFQDTYFGVCYYFPFYRTVTNILSFNQGKPISECPPNFPLSDHKFKHLCTQDVDDFFGGSSNTIHQNSLIRVIFIFCLIKLQKFVFY